MPLLMTYSTKSMKGYTAMTETVTYHVVQINETDHWRHDFREYGPIYGVYCYRPDVVYHMCEITPSHCLHYLYSYSEQEMPDELMNEFEEGMRVDDFDCYIWAHQMPLTVRNGTYEFDIDEGDNELEVVLEYFSGNHPV